MIEINNFIFVVRNEGEGCPKSSELSKSPARPSGVQVDTSIHKYLACEYYIKSRFQIAIDVKTIIIGHVLNNKYDLLLSFLR